MFKSRYLHFILQKFLDADIEKSIQTEYSKAKFRCSLYQHAIKVLMMFGGRNAAQKLAERTYSLAEKYELYEYLIFSSATIRNVSATKGDVKSVQFYSDKLKAALKSYQAESESMGLLHMMYALYSKPKPRKTTSIQIVEQLMHQAAQIKKRQETYVIQVNYYRIKGNYHLLLNDYKKSIKAWADMQNVVEYYKEFEFGSRIAEISTYMLSCYLNLKDYSNGLEYALASSSHFPDGSSNWFIQNEYRFLLLMHMHDYPAATLVLTEVKNHSRLKYLTEVQKGKWSIYEAYLYFIGLLKGNANPAFKKTFKKIVTQQPQHSMDKQGMYLSITFLVILELARKKELNMLSIRILSLTRMEKKYLSDPIFERAQLFISLLKSSYENDYFREATKRVSAKTLEKLNAASPAYTGNVIGFEIIPYDQLWEYYLRLLKY